MEKFKDIYEFRLFVRFLKQNNLYTSNIRFMLVNVFKNYIKIYKHKSINKAVEDKLLNIFLDPWTKMVFKTIDDKLKFDKLWLEYIMNNKQVNENFRSRVESCYQHDYVNSF